MSWTTTELLAALRRRGRLPDGQPSDADLLLDADEAMRTVCLPLLRVLQEGYGLTDSTQALVDAQSDYAIPTQAVGATVDDVLFVDSSGNEVSMPQVPHQEAWRYEDNPGMAWKAPYGFSLFAGSLRLLPTPVNPTGSLKVVFQERPGQLVAASRGAQVTSTTSTDVVVDGAGAFGGSGTLSIDIRDDDPPFALRSLAGSASWDGVDTFTYTATPDNVAVSDWVTLAGETVVVPLPDVMHPLLVSATLVYVFEALGHRQEKADAQDSVRRDMSAAQQLLEPRSRGGPRPAFNRNSPLRQGRRWTR